MPIGRAFWVQTPSRTARRKGSAVVELDPSKLPSCRNGHRYGPIRRGLSCPGPEMGYVMEWSPQPTEGRRRVRPNSGIVTFMSSRIARDYSGCGTEHRPRPPRVRRPLAPCERWGDGPIRSMVRTARGANRAPGRLVTPRSIGTPMTAMSRLVNPELTEAQQGRYAEYGFVRLRPATAPAGPLRSVPDRRRL